jgi:metacaspase-1
MANTRRGASLHIGIDRVDPDHYAGWSGPLNACVADAEDMHALATTAGFEPTILRTADARRQAVIEGIRGAAEALRAGDIFLVTYSGHGGQVPDWNGDEEDYEDETWCLYDGQLLDDELAQLWSGFQPGVRILVLSDSCHSGTVTRKAIDAVLRDSPPETVADLVERGVTGVYRDMPRGAARMTYRANRAFYDQLQRSLPAEPPEIRATVRLVSGCKDDQLSLDGTFNGFFTGTLLRVWRDGAFEGNYRAFHEAIAKRMPKTQSPQHSVIGIADADYDGQRPFTI